MPAEIQETIDKLNKGFEAYKAANDEKLQEIEKKGGSYPETAEKIARLETEIVTLREERDQRSSEVAGLEKRLAEIETRTARPGFGLESGTKAQQTDYEKRFEAWLRNPNDYQTNSELKKAESGLEQRAVSSLTDSAGGYLVPEQLSRQILRWGIEETPMRALARVEQAGTPNAGQLVDVGGTNFQWAGPGQTRQRTDTSSLEKVKPTSGMGYALPTTEEEILDDAFFDVNAWLIRSAREAIQDGQGQAFISGDGNDQPTGMLHAPTSTDEDAARTFGTLQYIPSGSANHLPTDFDFYISLRNSLRKRYRKGAHWYISSDAETSLLSVKDQQGRYMWMPSTREGTPDRFLGFPVTVDEHMPDIAAGAFPVAFGNFYHGYLIKDIGRLKITKDEITQPGFINYYVRRRVGGCVLDSNAIKLGKIAA